MQTIYIFEKLYYELTFPLYNIENFVMWDSDMGSLTKEHFILLFIILLMFYRLGSFLGFDNRTNLQSSAQKRICFCLHINTYENI